MLSTVLKLQAFSKGMWAKLSAQGNVVDQAHGAYLGGDERCGFGYFVPARQGLKRVRMCDLEVVQLDRWSLGQHVQAGLERFCDR
jgi:hypothetical protein